MSTKKIINASTEASSNFIVDKTEFIVLTYPDLQAFLEMVVTLMEGVYEHAKGELQSSTVPSKRDPT